MTTASRPSRGPGSPGEGRPSARPGARDRGARVLIGVVLLAVTVAFLWGAVSRRFLCDDAFISFRYAEHLAEGKGLVWNEGERVEGYSNLLWVLILAAGLRVGLSPETLSQGLGIAAGWALLTTAAWSWRRRYGLGIPGLAFLITLALHRSFLAWSTGGLETMFFAFLVYLGIVVFSFEQERREKRPWLSALVLGLAAWTRPEGLLFLAVAAAFLSVEVWQRQRRVAALVSFVAIAALLVLPQLAFRVLYYGDWLPNTFYAKVDGWRLGESLRFLGLYQREYWPLFFLPMILPALRGERAGPPRLFLAAVVAYSSYLLVLGGDRLEFRFLIVAVPFLYGLCFEGAQRWLASPERRPRRRALATLAVVALVFSTASAGLREVPYARRHGNANLLGIEQYARSRAAQGRLLRDEIEAGRLPRELVLAAGGAGAVPYYTGWETVDRRGLSDRFIARRGAEKGALPGHRREASYDYLASRGVAVFDVFNQLVHPSPRRVRSARFARFQGRSLRLRAVELTKGFLVFGTFLDDEELARLLAPRPLLGPEDLESEPGTAVASDVPGRWGIDRHLGRDRDAGDRRGADPSGELRRLASIGYLGGSIEDARTGVLRFREQATEPGLGFYTSGHAPAAFLIDLEGRELHRWKASYEEVWPDAQPLDDPRAQWWRRARLLQDGRVLGIFEGIGIFAIDAESRLLWEKRNAAHHDLEIDDEGRIYVLTRRPRLRDRDGRAVLEDFLEVLDPSGRSLRRISLLRAVERSHPEFLEQGKRSSGDITHTNAVHLLRGPFGSRAEAGDLLFSMNALGLIGVLDLESEELLWARKTSPTGQHDPQVVRGDHVLFFDNREGSGASAVLEIDPWTSEVLWSFEGSEDEPFYSRFCGAVQRLGNGNTLITESDAGRAFEVTEEGEIVWEFFNPRRTGRNGRLIAAISKMQRLPAAASRAWVDLGSGGAGQR